MSSRSGILNAINKHYQHTSSAKTASTNKVKKQNTTSTGNTGTGLNTVLSSGVYAKQAAAKYVKDNDKNKDGKLSCDEVTLSAEAFAKLDANSDGKVTKAEMQSALSGKDNAIYQYYKSGGTKTHAKDVVATVLFASNAGSAASTGTTAKQAASRYIKDHDKSKDGKLSRAETTLSEEDFATLDANDDGKLTRAELEKSLDGKGAAIDKYYQSGGEKTHEQDMADAVLFTSNAGSISNFSGLAASRFLSDKDKNGDGALSAGEAALSRKVFAKLDTNSDNKVTAEELNTALAKKNAAIQKYYKNGGTNSLGTLTSNLLATI